jgi:acyl dehydratase
MTRYATEILERRRAVAAGGPFPFEGSFEQLHEGQRFITRAGRVEQSGAFALLAMAAGLVPLDPARVTLRRIADVVFRRPVRPGEAVHVEGSVTSLAPDGEESGKVTLAWNVLDEAGRCVCRASLELQWAREQPCVAIPL